MWELVPDVFQLLMKYHARKMDYAMTPGLTQLTWTSLNLEPFLSKVQQAISQFERLTKQVIEWIMHFVVVCLEVCLGLLA